MCVVVLARPVLQETRARGFQYNSRQTLARLNFDLGPAVDNFLSICPLLPKVYLAHTGRRWPSGKELPVRRGKCEPSFGSHRQIVCFHAMRQNVIPTNLPGMWSRPIGDGRTVGSFRKQVPGRPGNPADASRAAAGETLKVEQLPVLLDAALAARHNQICWIAMRPRRRAIWLHQEAAKREKSSINRRKEETITFLPQPPPPAAFASGSLVRY